MCEVSGAGDRLERGEVGSSVVRALTSMWRLIK